MSVILSGLIYELVEETAYSPHQFVVPVEDWGKDMVIGDCWIVNRNGEKDPGLDNYPVPIPKTLIGSLVGRHRLDE